MHFRLSIIEERKEPVILLLRKRIVFVVVALRAGERRSQPDGCGRINAVHNGCYAILFRIYAALFINHGIPVKSGGDSLLERGIWEEVSGNLLNGELIERH